MSVSSNKKRKLSDQRNEIESTWKSMRMSAKLSNACVSAPSVLLCIQENTGIEGVVCITKPDGVSEEELNHVLQTGKVVNGKNITYIFVFLFVFLFFEQEILSVYI